MNFNFNRCGCGCNCCRFTCPCANPFIIIRRCGCQSNVFLTTNFPTTF